MLRNMRRKGQELPLSESERILDMCTHGVLALCGDDGYPYALPISYVYTRGRLIFHSALTGHKIDAIKRCGKASLCVVASDDVVPLEYTTRYRSVIVFGTLSIISEEERKMEDILLLARKYAPDDSAEHRQEEIIKSWKNFCIIEMSIDCLSGKESGALATERRQKT